jgi:hypothetical protein
MGDIARDRLGIRLYYGDYRRHAYRAADLNSPQWQQIHPICQDLDAVSPAAFFEQLYQLAHPTDMIDPHEHATLGADKFIGCDPCQNRLLVITYDILVGTDIVAVHGHLQLPAPRLGDPARSPNPVSAGT